MGLCVGGNARRVWVKGERERIHVFQFYTLHNFRKSSKTSVALDKIYDTLTRTQAHTVSNTRTRIYTNTFDAQFLSTHMAYVV